MKKVFSLLAVLALVCMAGTVFAADPTIEATHTAIASFTGGELSFSADLYNWNSTYTGSTATNITWSQTGIPLGSSDTKFKCADVYALIKSTITVANGKVWAYQDNRNNTSPYVATSSRTATDKGVTNYLYSGLIKANSGGGNNNVAPLEAYYKKLSEAKTQITTLPTEFPSGDYAYGIYWFKDVGDSNYVAKDDYMLVATSAGNYTGTNEDGRNYVKEDVVMFFGAYFTNVLSGESYGTTTIKFVSEVE